MKFTKIAFTLGMLAMPIMATGQDSTQSPEQLGLEHLTDYLGLKPSDIGYRADYTEPDSFRLQLVSDLMRQPLGMIDYVDDLSQVHLTGQPEILAGVLFSDLLRENQLNRGTPYRPSNAEIQRHYNLFYTNVTLNQLLTRAASYLNVIFPGSRRQSLAALSADQKRFLREEFKELLVTREDEEFMSVQEIDSVEQAEDGYCEEFVEFGYLIDPDPIVSAGIECLRELVMGVKDLQREMESTDMARVIATVGHLPDNTDWESYLGRQNGWAVGGTGNDYYRGDYRFIIDFGGDDVYDLEYDPANPHGVIIVDMAGNDHYRSKSDFTIGSGCFSVGLLLDYGGDDRYDGQSFGVGAGYFGLGVLYDAAGDDRYDGDTYTQGAGGFGLGLLIDEGGRDIYNAALYSQGFGFVRGIGTIYDEDGADCYYAGGKYKDILRYEDHYLSLSQGFGYGLRPWMSGGIGAIVDKAGNDLYYSDIFAQAASYWWSLGFIYDSSGNDNYQSFQYAQGAATHMTLGILIDVWGQDVYQGKGLMHGVGHDYSCAIMLDRHGNDVYIASDLSQGAGSANGAGILIDNEGNDRYFVKNPANTQGYGNPRRDFGSIGLFLDLGGQDDYFGNGHDYHYWRTDSKWGGGMDIELFLPDTTEGES